jgi:hypothetical protein
MTTLNGQSFAQAYSQVYQQMVFNGVSPGNVTAQPFIEAALGGANSAYCKGFASCTAALATNQTTLFKDTAVSDIWAAMNKAPSWILGRTMANQQYPGAAAAGQSTSFNTNTSLGWGNYNAVFVSLRMTNWHGLTAISNFTWGRALGTGQLAQYNSATTAETPYNIGANYGPQSYDIKFLYNLSMYYQPPVFKGQHGVLGTSWVDGLSLRCLPRRAAAPRPSVTAKAAATRRRPSVKLPPARQSTPLRKTPSDSDPIPVTSRSTMATLEPPPRAATSTVAAVPSPTRPPARAPSTA